MGIIFKIFISIDFFEGLKKLVKQCAKRIEMLEYVE